MITFAAQFDGFSTRADGSRILKLSTYEEFSEEVGKVVNGKIGQEYVVLMVISSEDDNFLTESKEDTLERFRRHMHALITDIEKLNGETDWKEKMKKILIIEGQIKESTKELDIQQLSQLIIRLKKYKHELEKKGKGF